MDKVVDIAVDERFMREALREAMAAGAEDEIPIGAVIVFGGRVIAKGHNMTERLHDPTAHAEMIAITAATEANSIFLTVRHDSVIFSYVFHI